MNAAWMGLLLVAAAASALAGTEDAPEILDAQGDTRDPLTDGGDILSAWIEGENETGFTTVIKLASFEDAPGRMTDHYFEFHVGGEAFCTFLYVNQHGNVEAAACRRDPDTLFQSDGVPTTGRLEPGRPAYVRVDFPFSYLGAPEGPLRLEGLRADTFDFKRVHDPTAAGDLGPQSLVDRAEGDAPYVARAAPPPDAARAPEPPGSARTPGLPLALLVAALAVTARGAQRV